VLRLEKIPMELLILLAEKKDQLVSREEITEKLWGKDVFLDTEQGINTAIRKIRQALRDDPEQSRYIQTVVGKGYRFIGPIKVTGKGGTGFLGSRHQFRRRPPFQFLWIVLDGSQSGGLWLPYWRSARSLPLRFSSAAFANSGWNR